MILASAPPDVWALFIGTGLIVMILLAAFAFALYLK